MVLPAARSSSAVVATVCLGILGFATALSCSAAAATLAPPKAARRPAADADAISEPSCKLTRFAAGRVTTVIDGRTFVLDDGRAIRLAAIEVPPVTAPGEARRPVADPVGSVSADPLSAGETARRALAALVIDRDVVVKYADATPPPVDRYEHFVGYGFVTDGTAEHSLQEALLASGQAQLSVHVEPAACRSSLRAREDAARRAALGLWADPVYSVHDAVGPADIRPRRGRFAVIEGEVVSVRESHGTIYVNFSQRWSKGFSAFIRKRNTVHFPAAGRDLRRLKGRRVEVRGYVEQRRGLLMAVERPEQIAIIADHTPTRP